jgi:AmmeMemoRadiSam system protein A
MDKGSHPLAQLARQAVESYVQKHKVIRPGELVPEMKERAGVFVSLKKHGQLRGCIGTFEPTQASVAEEVIQNAISSATGDPRFSPVGPDELGSLDYSVDVLTRPEAVEDRSQLDAKKSALSWRRAQRAAAGPGGGGQRGDADLHLPPEGGHHAVGAR